MLLSLHWKPDQIVDLLFFLKKKVFYHSVQSIIEHSAIKANNRNEENKRRAPGENNGKTVYRSGTVNSKSFVGKVLLRIKWKFELTVYFKHEILGKL